MKAQCSPLHDVELEFYPKRRGKKRADYSGRMTQAQAKALIQEVRQLYELPSVKLEFRDFPTSRRCAWVESQIETDNELYSSTIVFTGVNPLCAHTLLHELSHVVVDHIYGHDKTPIHGLQFVGIMSWLFDYFKVIPTDALGLILRRHGVRRLPARSCTPDVLRRRRANRLRG